MRGKSTGGVFLSLGRHKIMQGECIWIPEVFNMAARPSDQIE